MAEDLAALKQEVQEVLREEKEEKAVRSHPFLDRVADSSLTCFLRFPSSELPTWRFERERT